jgi:hypothetical protein
MQVTLPSHADAPAALLMGALFLTFGLFPLFRPHKIRTLRTDLQAHGSRAIGTHIESLYRSGD